ncbi:MAG TPA: non-ribosomal peptide synthetase [Chitinophaga sp.]|uniref:non-ribosomal peptide synthetase n=1 Tax=Chitinophaga sp. TaxID=1869181 RepID=UPI002CEB9115|nr:non-ribosomal peptide synthetase [Chitinophaga sp.]HVI46051.1 non-ribosomal peptide synthetase [Chitinophaga sp.]
MSPSLLTDWFSHPHYQRIPVVNAYGPTEASDDITHHLMYEAPAGHIVPLGRPVQNLHIYVLGRYGQLCAPGIAGEICVSGIGVSRGYLNRPDLTADRFVKDPFRVGEKMYRTGDLGRWLEDGTIEYLGRIDEQVKIRGYRIELGEIENILQQHEGVQQCAVIAKSDQQGIKWLAGFVVPAQGQFDREAIALYLREQLPEYMVPALMELAEMPLTPNGKIDKKFLSDIAAGETVTVAYVAPRNETEEALAGIWRELLRVERVGVHDNFFDLGGHSLLVMRMAAAILETLRTELTVRTLFEHPTLESLAAFIITKQAAETKKRKRIILD